jgi:hypothetical protein
VLRHVCVKQGSHGTQRDASPAGCLREWILSVVIHEFKEVVKVAIPCDTEPTLFGRNNESAPRHLRLVQEQQGTEWRRLSWVVWVRVSANG